MSDADIIKALECCDRTTNKGCPNCPLFEYDGELTCITVISNKVLDLINRQKAEIEELQLKIESCNSQIDALENEIHTMVEYQTEV